MSKKMNRENNINKHRQKKSLFRMYLKQFKKHKLGKIGFYLLITLYLMAMLADFISPYSMTWMNKRKSLHPPSRIYFFYKNKKNKYIFRPFVYENHVTNIMLKTYEKIPEYSLRLIIRDKIPGFDEMRIITWHNNPVQRKQQVVSQMTNKLNLLPDAPILQAISEKIDEIENSEKYDDLSLFHHKIINTDKQVGNKQFILIKGNKNFLGLGTKGIPYDLFNIFKVNRHLFGSESGGFFPMGTDELGRDVFSRLLHGGRISLSVGLVGILISFFFGIAVGGISGYFGGILDSIIMRFCEILLSFPYLILLFALRATFPPDLNSVQVYLLIIIIMSFINWAYLARIIRGMVLSIKNEEYVLSAKTIVQSPLKILGKHIIPNTFSFLIIQATISVPQYILGESSLSFLGLGITEPQSSWGLMLSIGRNTRYIKDFPWLLIPGFFIFLSIMAWNFFGDGIRDAVDPYSKFK